MRLFRFRVIADKRTEVVRMVEQLNLAVARCAERLAGGLPVLDSDSQRLDCQHLRAMSRFEIGEFIGDAVISMLEAAHATTAAVQIAIRASLVSYCDYIISFWDDCHRFENSTQELYRGLKQLGVLTHRALQEEIC
jgi:hypothetical protein